MKTDFKILVVDDEESMRDALKQLLKREGYTVDVAENAAEAIKKFKKENHDLVVSDIMMPEIDGIELLKRLKKISQDVIVILITGYASIDSAVQAIKIGAEDYFTKPFKNVEILKVVDRIYKNQSLSRQNELLKQEILRQDIPEIVGQSTKIKKIISDIKMVADSDIPVFISGESGTGKELVARAVHDLSERKNEPFVPINCAAVPDNLLESEFFGHEKGAFSGAIIRKYGLFEVADNGTLFLDEIGEMPQSLQAKLLRTVETMQLRRIGGTVQISVNLRIVCSTNRDIQKEIEEGRFRSDLYYRLSTFCIHLPPLRERKEDIPLIVEQYLKGKNGGKTELSETVLKAFLNYDWPGNVRELEHVIERILLFSKNKVPSIKNLPQEIQGAYRRETPSPVKESSLSAHSLQDVEKDHILSVLNHCNGNKKKAAEILGIGLKTLYRKIEEYA